MNPAQYTGIPHNNVSLLRAQHISTRKVSLHTNCKSPLHWVTSKRPTPTSCRVAVKGCILNLTEAQTETEGCMAWRAPKLMACLPQILHADLLTAQLMDDLSHENASSLNLPQYARRPASAAALANAHPA